MLTPVLLLLLGIVVILVIIAANGYFVAQEFAYMSVDRAQLSAQADEGDASAKRALKVTRRTSFMLSGAQLGITVTGLLVGYVAEPLVGQSLGTLLGGVGVPPAVSISIGTVLALGLSTVVQMIFGELYPKNLAIANPGPLARGLARSTNIYLGIFGWLITIFDHAANGLLRLLRIQPVEDLDSSANASDLQHIVSDSRESGHLEDHLSLMLDRIIDFPQRDVEHAMVPWAKTDTVDSDTTIGEVRARMAVAHTRYAVLGKDDEPIGVVHLLDVLGSSSTPDEPVVTIMRDPVIVPMVMMLPQALERLLEAEEEFACVIDEYGGLAGILTIEDLAEEVAGELTDEHDVEIPTTIEPQGSQTWKVAGDLPIDEVEREVGQRLPRGDYETVAGMLIAYLQDLPKVDQSIRMELPQMPSDLIRDEPVTRYLHVSVLGLDKRVPTLVEMSLESISDDAASQEEVQK